jgi:serine protease Do
MKRLHTATITAALAALALLAGPASAQAPFAKVCQEVNKKLVKLYGAGGFRGLTSYGTGILVSPDGYILTANSTLLDTENLRVHLYDGRTFQYAKVVAREPMLDAALVKLDKVDDLPYFDIAAAAKQPLGQTGDWVLAFSNQFHIATRDEPMTVQRGVIAAYSKLHGRRGTFEFPYTGDVYVVDAITNNPGAAGGALTTRKGELLGIIGKELRNSQTDTWMNYAIPIQARVEVKEGDKVRIASIVEIVEKKENYKPLPPPKFVAGRGGYHGITLVPAPGGLRTPPFIEDVAPGSPAAKAGLKPDDLVIYIFGQQVTSTKAFQEIMSKIEPGTKVVMDVQRVVDKKTGAEKLITVEFEMAKPIVRVTPKK